MVDHTNLEEVWFVISPHNPLKKKSTLANNYDRLYLVQLAIGGNPNLRTSSIEFNLPQPSYTIDTLTHLKEKYPKKEFTLIMGGDNLRTFHKWKNYELILRDYTIYVYARPNYELGPFAEHERVQVFDEVPQMSISASFIRKNLREGKSIKYLVSEPVFEEIMKSNLYRE